MSQPVMLASDTIEADGVHCPPTNLWSDEPPLESDFHRDQIDLLIGILRWWWRDRDDAYVSGNLTVYYNQQQLKSRDFRGPDFFVVLGTEKKDRRSWVVWDEQGQYPNLILEILSNSTRQVDKGPKKQLYQNIFRTPDYFWFDPDTVELQGFHLLDGQYESIQPTEQGWLWSQQLELYLGVNKNKLRFFTSDGELIPSPEELAAQEHQRAEQEHQRAEQERQRAEQERQRAEQERQRAEQAEQELEQLRAQMKSRGTEAD
ncbi:Uma2 family endonuclease [Halomicronema hongdechloris]|nr:Uma2 family endonuclease [Halomicronema hongdechloris]